MPYYDEYGYPKPPRPRNDQVDSDPGVAQETRYSYSENNGHKEADAATWDWDSYWDSRIANSRSATAAKKKKQHDQQQGQVPTQKSSQSESSFTTQFDQEERHGYNSKEIEYEDTFIDRYLGNVKKQPQTQHQSHEQNGQQQQQARSNQERNPYESENWFVDYFRNNNGAKLPGVEYLEAVQEFLSDKVVSEHNRGYPHPENLEWETRRLKKRPNKKWNGFWGVNKVQPVPGAKSPKYYQPAPNAPIFPEELRITFRSASFFVIYVMMMGLLFFSVYEVSCCEASVGDKALKGQK
ncbi:hypothetical protein BC830DRAFT_1154035 [Chytriomyces sp. MP71]|nr:hypothetical protein BC830DRAFT_1154035 [Chytriomyces sp. MP71]